MMKLVFSTGNLNKANEIKSMLPEDTELLTLKDLDLEDDIPETAPTLEGNAKLKAKYVVEHYNIDCFADDTGLEVYCLNNEPGILSARYAGEQKSSEDNIKLLLSKLIEKNDRRARFRTVIALHLDGNLHTFEGIVEGKIIHEKRGEKGFGYDPIFVPDGYDITFAEMSLNEKNMISHRAKAFAKMIEFLNAL